MLSRLTRLTTMSSNIVNGLSHLWDDRTAPNAATKGTHQELNGFGHDHGFYCGNNLNNVANPVSTQLTSLDDPFLGVPHRPDWNASRVDCDPLIGQVSYPVQESIIDVKDLGGRLTPEDNIPWYERNIPWCAVPEANFRNDHTVEKKRTRNNSWNLDMYLPANFDSYAVEKPRTRNDSWNMAIDLPPVFESLHISDCSEGNTKSRNNSLNLGIGLPSVFGNNNNDFSLLAECDWESPVFNTSFLDENYLSPEPGDWPKVCDLAIDDALSESSQNTDYSRFTPSPLIQEEEEVQKCSTPELEYTQSGRVKRQCRRVTVMDIMLDACDVPEPKRAKNARAMTLDEYFESSDACLDRPKARGIVIKPYVDDATARRREKNRVSARKYRDRKRLEKDEVKSTVFEEEKRNTDLKEMERSLQNEIAFYKKKLNML